MQFLICQSVCSKANYLFAAELQKFHCDATFKFLAKCFHTNVCLMIFQLTLDLENTFIFKRLQRNRDDYEFSVSSKFLINEIYMKI